MAECDCRRYLLTVPGRGYQFVAPISSADDTSAAASPSAKRLHNLPTMLTRLIGRADTVSKLAQQLQRRRFLSIVGTGGVGTTSVALALAEALLSSYEDGVWFVELAPLVDPRLVPAALAAALGLEFRAEDLLPALLSALRYKQMLLDLDNCEHVIDAAAGLAASILSGCRACIFLRPVESRCGQRASTCTGCDRSRALPVRRSSPRRRH